MDAKIEEIWCHHYGISVYRGKEVFTKKFSGRDVSLICQSLSLYQHHNFPQNF